MTTACTPKEYGAGGSAAPLGEVTVVAPIQEASAIGHALTLRRPLRLEHRAADVLRRRRHADRLRQHSDRARARTASPT